MPSIIIGVDVNLYIIEIIYLFLFNVIIEITNELE